MDIASVGSSLSMISQSSTGDAVGIAVLKKALDAQAQTAMQLIAALPPVSNPPNLGNHVDTKA
jgi:hypothetical protein